VKNNRTIWVLALFGIVAIVLALRVLSPGATPWPIIAYSQFKLLAEEARINSVVFTGQEITGELKAAEPLFDGAPAVKKFRTYQPAAGDSELLPLLEKKAVTVTVRPDSGAGNLLRGFLPWVVIFALYIWFWRRMQANLTGHLGGRSPSDFLTGSSREERKAGPQVTFDDVAGQDAAKQEVAELVDFLRNPERYRALGAEPPRGVLLMGPPGTGKTLLARALAGEAGVSFYSTSASEFIELYVGVGASRVRQMFVEAKKRAPAIIFIDELDAVGRVRGTGLGGGNDEREQTLNQILAEMDGFTGHESVIILAATNRPDVLDPALLRPGRFDRHVTLELPDRKARRAILAVHCRKVPLAQDVDLELIAAATPGFSGADLKNLVNEAAMAAAREGVDKVTMAHFDAMRDKVIMGNLRTLAIKPAEKHRLAVHEAGHTALAHFLPLADPLYKVTIIPRGRSLGGTHMIPQEDWHSLPEDYLKTRLAVALAGRAAERLFLGTVSSGADDDIKQATALARAMVARWGMDEDIGPVDLRDSEEHPFLGREIAQPRRLSDSTAHEVDVAVRALLNTAETKAVEVLEGQRAAVTRLIASLEERETLGVSDIEACLDRAPLTSVVGGPS
jgi:cell division protease FtsH